MATEAEIRVLYEKEEEITLAIAKTKIAIGFAQEIKLRPNSGGKYIAAAQRAEVAFLELQIMLRQEQIELIRQHNAD